ncbi:hypothetical protein C8R43DRAFT_1116889 [Mycena crocata]|nr:hypothetical protein C8R43DRAFT_1116889 [Mycena crocata]
MSTSLASTPTVDVRLSYGPLLVGVFFNLILFGVLIAQQLAYFQTARKDRLWMRLLVWSVFFVETANSAFDMAIVYEPLVLHYGEVPDKLPTVFITQPLCVLLVSFPIQMFFIWRIRTLTQTNIIPAIIFAFSLVGLGGGVWTTVMIPIAGRFSRIPMLYRSAEVWFISSSVADGATVNFIWAIPLSKLYSNSLMSALNARTQLREMGGKRLTLSSPQQNIVLSNPYDDTADSKLPREALQHSVCAHYPLDLNGTDSTSQLEALDTFAHDEVGTAPRESDYGIRMTTVVERA